MKAKIKGEGNRLSVMILTGPTHLINLIPSSAMALQKKCPHKNTIYQAQWENGHWLLLFVCLFVF